MIANLAIAVVFSIGVITLLYMITSPQPNRGAATDEKRPPLKLPLIGDLHSSPIDKPLANWDDWARQNGPITVSRLFGIVPVVILNSYEAATELFSRRSQWYSNRPRSATMEMITGAKPGQSRFTLMHDYDDYLRLHHRLLAPSLGALAAPRYQPLMELENNQLLCDLCDALHGCPDGATISTATIYPLLKRTQSSIILGLHYGLRILHPKDELLQEIIGTQAQVTHLAANPGLPDLIPTLRQLPGFLSPWKRAADELFATQSNLYMRLFHRGRDSDSWNATKQALATAERYTAVPDLDLAFTLATSIQGGMETSPRQMLWLFIAMLHRPSVLSRAHAVLDAVVGRSRAPRFSDRPKLVYIDAIAHELFRWRPISPGSIPRRADLDDEFQGVKISQGATIMANAWAVGRDAHIFNSALGDLHDFVPDRWLLQRNPHNAVAQLRSDLPLPVFGQGRRICQGKRIATDGAFLQVANLLWAFDIMPAEEEEMDPWAMTVVGFMTMPKELKMRLKPRGDWVMENIKREPKIGAEDLDQVMGSVNDVEK
ncbi:hypothetical protein CBS115989_1490 [Aspergillus niger]|uniref:Contig An14c0200, genomic contig n=3 Tax=Aspergillus niger TaxID=5061 RepID=A2R4B9_ASPNC|nr:uncharacterized protein An14g07260 [Aspergillus niger]RDH25473.1 cytochrome P450 [Aspergillus niger ATCC 13496]KAI2823508.1 hypothetical protein CBS115989_1490 [Aspergillus niger]KAI2846469.1 hypothetical protein CBS11232_7419 [Aspergillus niger]KAI2876071.1 hypothetical protein CBS115988_4852 [Aspergillus niger]CAK46719.1 unnamed protein product [Aspergillus niger]|eukprot:XP_001401349.1 cytochrome p450 [Aspergillus niger CBS 513.88]